MSERPGPVDDEKARARVEAAAQMLQRKMKTDPELQRLAGTLLFSYRLAYWLISEICAHEDMTNEMAQWLIQAQDQAAKESFNFVELMKDLKQERLPWLESRFRDSLARQKTLARRAQLMTKAIRRKDIQLPFHSMTTKFGEDGFQHGDTLVVFGKPDALELVLRHCSKQYRRAGGRAIFMSMERKESYGGIASTVLSSAGWCNAGDITSSLHTLLDPLLKPTTNQPPAGLVVVENLDHMLTEQVDKSSLKARRLQAFMNLQQHQVDHGYAAIIGVPFDSGGHPATDEDVPNVLLDHRFVKATVQHSAIIGADPVVAVDNDVIRMPDIVDQLKE